MQSVKTIGMDEEEIASLSNDIKSKMSEEIEALGKYITAKIDTIISEFEKQNL